MGLALCRWLGAFAWMANCPCHVVCGGRFPILRSLPGRLQRQNGHRQERGDRVPSPGVTARVCRGLTAGKAQGAAGVRAFHSVGQALPLQMRRLSF